MLFLKSYAGALRTMNRCSTMSFGSGVLHSQNCPVPGDSDNLKNLANGCQINLWIGFPFAPKKK